ncbi:nucleolar protein 6 [Cryptococcus wingfieldii CBS 7118]|uniref:Nucleolar protein 12 n=1 Tax=Cryptococcus wingfieldii CBS 7118 TaxID=1295528 RepID=A0A1E3JWJ4_9TREE|nr:nucleolar protein 6 [Cryptococcus wingfieldii CBS 7118]ODO05231.1 nucleolar protein 6 [Cryptococcus wingfieldii CBS 7118]
MSTTLTKKQQKALAFRSKQKAKKSGTEVPEDLPEQDLDDNDENEQPEVVVKANEKEKSAGKRKRDDEEEKEPSADDEDTTTKPEDKGKGKETKKRKTAWDEEEEGKKNKGRKDAKQRFILFIGNLTFKTTREEIQKHFEPAVGHLPSVRLLTTKATPTQPSKSRGIAFLEVPSSTAMQACLKLHHTTINARTINVELTAGGGGAGEERKKKLDERNQRVGTQREKKAEKERELNGGEDPAPVEQPMADGKKTRGGRRVRAKAGDQASGDASSRPYQQSSGGYGRAGQGGPQQNGRGPYQKKKWEPTGSNFITVAKRQ